MSAGVNGATNSTSLSPANEWRNGSGAPGKIAAAIGVKETRRPLQSTRMARQWRRLIERGPQPTERRQSDHWLSDDGSITLVPATAHSRIASSRRRAHRTSARSLADQTSPPPPSPSPSPPPPPLLHPRQIWNDLLQIACYTVPLLCLSKRPNRSRSGRPAGRADQAHWHRFK